MQTLEKKNWWCFSNLFTNIFVIIKSCFAVNVYWFVRQYKGLFVFAKLRIWDKSVLSKFCEKLNRPYPFTKFNRLVHSWILFPIWKLVWWGKVDQLSKISLMYAKIFQAYKLENLLLIFQSFFLWGHHQNPEEDFSIIINKNVESLEDTSIKFQTYLLVLRQQC